MDILIYSTITNFIYFCAGCVCLSKNKLKTEGYFYVFFIGLISLSFTSLLLNFFFKLSPSFNSIIYILVIILFFIKTKFTTKLNKRIIIFLFISSIFTFLLIIYSNVNRPDAGLYHLPYISLLNENKIILGISNIHSRFAHISVLQYLSALNYNLLFLENGISIPLASIVSFFYIYFFNDILRVVTKKDEITYSKIFSLFITIYISYKINRYSGFGNDAIAHLSFFYLISYFLKSNLENIDLKKLTIISVFIFINKPMLGLVFFIPLFVIITNKDNRIKLLLLTTFSFPTLFLFLWLLKNIFISGCMIYPLKMTCINNLEWTNSSKITQDKMIGSAWSKAWPDRLDKKISMSEYNKNFNWIESWSKIHLKYIIRIVTPFLFIVVLMTFYFKFHSKNTDDDNDKNFRLKINFLIIFCLFGLICFFMIFPIYRYGYSYLITIICLLAIYSNKKKITSIKNINVFKIFFIICILVITTKQFIKINNNYSQNKLWPNIYTLGDKINSYEKIVLTNNFHYFYAFNGDNLCMYSKSPCTSYKVTDEIRPRKKLGYTILSLKND